MIFSFFNQVHPMLSRKLRMKSKKIPLFYIFDSATSEIQTNFCFKLGRTLRTFLTLEMKRALKHYASLRSSAQTKQLFSSINAFLASFPRVLISISDIGCTKIVYADRYREGRNRLKLFGRIGGRK